MRRRCRAVLASGCFARYDGTARNGAFPTKHGRSLDDIGMMTFLFETDAT
jgi:hypothetical protein